MANRQLLLSLRKHRKNSKAFLVEEHLVYGGALNYRKKRRPFLKSRATHFVLRSNRLEGARSLLKQNRTKIVEAVLISRAKRYGAYLYKYSINSNHIHLLIRFTTAKLQADFLRDFAGTLALKLRRLLDIQHGSFWQARPFSSMVKRSAYNAIQLYIEKNRNEAAGVWAYQPRPVSELARILDRIARRRSQRLRGTDLISTT